MQVGTHAKFYAEYATDDFLELLFNRRMFSENHEENAALLSQFQIIVWTRMAQLEGLIRDELCVEYAELFIRQRQMLHSRISPLKN